MGGDSGLEQGMGSRDLEGAQGWSRGWGAWAFGQQPLQPFLNPALTNWDSVAILYLAFQEAFDKAAC